MPAHPTAPGAALSAALALAAHGFALFPCLATKAPACPHGHLDAASDPPDVRALWRRWPGPLIGTPTGDRNGFDALDIDPRHGGDAWYATYRSRLPATRMHQTRSGGLHILFRHHDEVRNSVGKIAPGIDVRGEGGFVIWWPAAGSAVLARYPLTHWPNWLLAVLLPPPPPPRPSAPSCHISQPGTPAARIITATLTRLELAGPGHKHERLRAAACTMGGLMDEAGFSSADAERVLFDAVKRAGGAGVVERNARATIAWGLEKGRQSPLRTGGAVG